MHNEIQIKALGTAPVGKLLWQYALPAIVAMVASSLYNIIDGVFIGKWVGAYALIGLGITMPLMSLMAAFGMLVGAGAATLMSVKLGQKDYAIAGKILGNVIMLTAFFGLSLMIITLIFLDPILYFFGASPKTLPYARDFVQIFLYFNIPTHMFFGLNALLRSVGKPQKAMVAIIVTVLINAALAPLFIYVFDWGIRGAACATIVAQICVLLWQLHLFSNPKELVHIRRDIFVPNKRIIIESLGIGMSPFLINVTACLVVIILNRTLVKYGSDVAVGAYSISNRLVFLFIMTIIGINQGMQPIAGYNFGAKHVDRLLGVLKRAILFGTLMSTLGFMVFTFGSRHCVSAFTDDPALLNLSEHALRTMVLCFPLLGMQIVATAFFQCIGYIGQSIFLSLTRQLIFLLPMLLILPHFWGLDGVWYAIPISDLLSCILTITLLVRQVRKFQKEPLTTTL